MLMSLTAAALILSAADQDAVISTAPRGQAPLPVETEVQAPVASPSTTVETATPHGLDTAGQIAQWIGQGRAERPASDRPWADSWSDPEPRRPRGEISLGVGTGGYRDYAAAVELPLGESGTLNLSVRQSRNDPYAFDPYHDRRLGIGPYGYDGFYGLQGYRGLQEDRRLQGWGLERERPLVVSPNRTDSLTGTEATGGSFIPPTRP